ncbi:MAG: helix-turn-helix transcriptional regulator [Gammaproteobacteria bacterium]
MVVSEEPAHTPSLLTLTPRERQIVAEAAAGSSNQQIAVHLGISHATVRVLMARAANRLGVRTRKALLAHPRPARVEQCGGASEPSRAVTGGRQPPACRTGREPLRPDRH